MSAVEDKLVQDAVSRSLLHVDVSPVNEEIITLDRSQHDISPVAEASTTLDRFLHDILS